MLVQVLNTTEPVKEPDELPISTVWLEPPTNNYGLSVHPLPIPEHETAPHDRQMDCSNCFELQNTLVRTPSQGRP